jgi:hypothetical protein
MMNEVDDAQSMTRAYDVCASMRSVQGRSGASVKAANLVDIHAPS